MKLTSKIKATPIPELQVVRPLTAESFQWVRAYMEKVVEKKLKSPLDDDRIFFRHSVHNDPFFVSLHHQLEPLACRLAGSRVKRSYVFASLYHDSRSICPLHTDRPQCRYTLDLCVRQKEPWAVNVAGSDFYLNEGDALFYSGTEHRHFRSRIQPGNFCDLILFHFVPWNFRGPLG